MDAPIAARSWLFAPGDSERKMTKALESKADVVLLDLEDAVAPEAKADARCLVRDFLKAHPQARARLWVRINPLDGLHALHDLAAVVPAMPGGIMLPKVHGREDAEQLDQLLSELEAAGGIGARSIAVIVLATETAAAMFRTGDYRGAPRLAALTWGAEDLADALGASANRDGAGSFTFTYELARSLTLLGAAAAGIPAIETISADFRDLDALGRVAAKARCDGFSGMLAIHPAQVPVINAAFTPSAEEIKEARAIVALFAENPAMGALALNGRMLDRPHLARAQRVLRQASR